MQPIGDLHSIDDDQRVRITKRGDTPDAYITSAPRRTGIDDSDTGSRDAADRRLNKLEDDINISDNEYDIGLTVYYLFYICR